MQTYGKSPNINDNGEATQEDEMRLAENGYSSQIQATSAEQVRDMYENQDILKQ